MQNQKNYQDLNDEQEYTGGIPVGQPLHYELNQVQQNQQPYFQQVNQNQYPNANQYPNVMPPQPVYAMNQQGQAPMIVQP